MHQVPVITKVIWNGFPPPHEILIKKMLSSLKGTIFHPIYLFNFFFFLPGLQNTEAGVHAISDKTFY